MPGRRRKTRCVFRSEIQASSTCLECFSRGAACTSQTESNTGLLEASHSRSLKARVADLENHLRTVLPNDVKNTSDKQLRAELLPSLPLSPALDLPTENHEDAPLLSIFQRSETIGKSNYGSSKMFSTCQTLRSLLPLRRNLESILTSTSFWWQSWRPICPHIVYNKCQKSLLEFVTWGSEQSNPVMVSLALLCVVISIQQFPPGTHFDDAGNPLPLKDLMDACLSQIGILIIGDDEYPSCCEGIEVMVLQAKCYVNLGRPQKAWLLLHRAIAVAQLIGLHKNGNFRQKETYVSNEERQNIWWTLNELDRYLSLILGLPFAVGDESFSPRATEDFRELNVSIYRQKLSLMAGIIVDRDRSVLTSDVLSSTLDTNSELADLEVNLPPELRKAESPTIAEGRRETYRRLMIRFWHFQLKVFLNLPFLLQSRENRALDQNHRACFSASRQMLRLYHVMRLDSKAGFHICEVVDFQGFTAALILILGLPGYREMCPSRGGSREKNDDSRLIDFTIRIMEDATSEYGGSIVYQWAQVLKKLRDTLSQAESDFEDGQSKSAWTESISVPYFGIITISTGDRIGSTDSTVISTGHAFDGECISLPNEPGQPSKASASYLPNDLETENFMEEFRQYADVDWQTLVNMDFDQDWNWSPLFPGEDET